MRNLQVLFFSLTLLFSGFAQAEWNSDALHFSTYGFGEFPGPATTPLGVRGILAALWGGGVRDVKMYTDLRSDTYDLSMPVAFEKPVTVYLRKQVDSRRSPDRRTGKIPSKRSPLMVYIPGVFGDADTPIAQGMIAWFSRMGYHVLTVPNCWSQAYQGGKPVHRFNYPQDETNAVLAITKWALKEIGEDAVSDISISGESLGGLTAAIVYSTDSHSTRPLFTGGATLYWPPIELSASVYALNDLLNSTADVYDEKCASFIGKIKTKFRIYTGRLLSSPVAEEIECAPAIVAQFSFKKELMHLAKKMLKTNGRSKETLPANLDFLSFMDLYAPRYKAALNANDRKGDLAYWIQSTAPSAQRGFAILTSEDDFVNANQNWNSVRAAGIQSDQLITLSWGGHIGATNHAAFRQLLIRQFKR